MGRFLILLSLLSLVSCSDSISRVSNSLPGAAVVYGSDNRQEFYQITQPQWRSLAAATVVIISAEKLQDEGNRVRFINETLGGSYKLCSGERFFQQPSVGNCSGTLVAKNMILTAGHCIEDGNDCKEQRFVFGYALQAPQSLPWEIFKQDVYSCKKVVKRGFDKNAGDFALVELDRDVDGREPIVLSKENAVKTGDEVTSIAYPLGLPVKFTPGGSVRQISGGYFVTNLDTFSGSSGGAVFNSQTGALVGVLVRGEKDFSWDKDRGCLVVNTCAEGGCRGEDVISISHILSLINKN